MRGQAFSTKTGIEKQHDYQLFNKASALTKNGFARRSEVEYPLRFRWTKRHEDFCIAENIFLEHILKIKGVYKQWKPWWFKKGKTFTVTCDIFAENFATMPQRGLCSVGAYSYALSRLPNEMHIGRYCSIAQGLTFMGSQHPTDRFTTSPITYHEGFARLSGVQQLEGFNENSPLPIIGHCSAADKVIHSCRKSDPPKTGSLYLQFLHKRKTTTFCLHDGFNTQSKHHELGFNVSGLG